MASILKRWDIAIQKATRRALATTLRRANKAQLQIVTRVYNIRQKQIRELLTIRKPSLKRLEGSITVRRKPITLEKFTRGRLDRLTTRATPTGRRRNPVIRVKIKKKSGSQVVKDAFAGRGSGVGRILLYKREGTTRYPIRTLHGPTITTMYTEEATTVFKRVVQSEFPKELKKDTKFFIGKL